MWARDEAASVAFRADSAGLVLSYRDRREANSHPVEQRVALSWVSAAFGGTRVYFICPGSECGRQVSILHFADRLFLCRRCHGLAYESQSEDARRRARRRANKHHARLDWPCWGFLAQQFAARPKGQWRTTFRRLLKSVAAADAKAESLSKLWHFCNKSQFFTTSTK
jgi:hypothetical protein